MTDFDKIDDLLEKNIISEKDILNYLSKKKKDDRPEYNTCLICLEKVVLPVQINGIPVDKNIEIVGNRNNMCSYRPCPNSKNNMVCLLCWRNYLKMKKKTKEENIYCLTKCCKINKQTCCS